jgi:hypothetical protein
MRATSAYARIHRAQRSKLVADPSRDVEHLRERDIRHRIQIERDEWRRRASLREPPGSGD